ncbi:hypothetical protein WJX74_008670 [Apatococcus lobatus]|uniref:Protein kinase domain-containing protein n=1 Tax=Apatococcus lobatus TaxID=904363 RepID=A0AAW1RMI9_9CHLO
MSSSLNLGAFEPTINPDDLQFGNALVTEGSNATVYRGILRSGNLELPVAIKPFPLSSEAELKMMRREIQILENAARQCAHTCRMYGTCAKKEGFCIVMKLYEGTLAHALQRLPGRRMGVGRALPLMIDIAHGVAELHSTKIVMCDLKPQNVLLDDHGTAVLADFGISRTIERTCANFQATQLAGTPAYMSPEAFEQSGVQDNKTDIWSLGCLFVEMLSGVPPWPGLTMMQIAYGICIGKKKPPMPEGLPSALHEMLLQCFQHDPYKRPSAKEILATLRGIIEERWAAMAGPSAAVPVPMADASLRSTVGSTGSSVMHPRTPNGGTEHTMFNSHTTEFIPIIDEDAEDIPNAFAGTGTVQASEYPSISPFGQPSIQSHPLQTGTFAADQGSYVDGQGTGTVQAGFAPQAFGTRNSTRPSGSAVEQGPMPNAFAMPTQSSSAAATRSPAATSQSAGQPHGYGNEQYNALLPPTNSGPVRGLSLPRTFTNASQESRQLGGHQPHQDPLAEDPMRSFADEENNVFAQVLRTQEMNDPFAQASLQQTQAWGDDEQPLAAQHSRQESSESGRGRRERIGRAPKPLSFGGPRGAASQSPPDPSPLNHFPSISHADSVSALPAVPSSVPAVSLQRLIPHPVRNDHVDRQTITTCVGHLRSSGTGPLQDAAAEQLYEVASNSPGYAASIADQGAIGPLLNALQYSENPETQRASAGIIRVLAETPSLRGRIHQANAIPLLIQFASSKIVALAEQALGALRYLALGGQYIQEQMDQCGGTHVVVQQLRHPRAEIHLNAAEALKNLSLHPLIALAAILTGALPILNSMRHNQNTAMVDAVAGIIFRMSQHAGTRPRLASEQVIPTLIAFLPRESLSEHSPSLGALTNLARGNPANCNLIVQAGGMQVLLDSCSSQISVAYQQLAAEFIEVLATNSEASCKSLFDHGGLRSLLVWLQSHQAPVRLATLRGVQQLCLSHGMKVKSTFIAMGGMQILIQIPAQDVYEQTALLDLLIVLVERKAYAAEQLCHFSGLAKLASMLSSNSEHASGLAATAIRLVISHKECRAAMKDAMVYHIPERLNAMLRSKSPQLQRPAALLALRLASRQENRHNLQQILGPALQSLSSDASTDHETRQAATEASAAIRSSASLKLSFSHFFKSKS